MFQNIKLNKKISLINNHLKKIIIYMDIHL